MLPVCALRMGESSHPALASPRPQTGIRSLLQGWRAEPHLAHGDWVPARLGEETGGSSDSKHSLYYVFDPEEKLSAGGGGGEGPPCLGAPPWATTPSGSQAMPSRPLRAPGLFHWAGGVGREEERKGGRGSPWSEPEPRAWSPQSGLGAGGLRLARPLPGTQGLDLPRSLGWEWRVMSRGGVIINQKKKK